ncbi:hypothetical protein BMETH_1613_0 [methanotrophic bacterial endosymbiont of Bathymodiolus sp.]|nr:hypothetical protein BMETH_1613_0 [methanotrophic bacterial endosymbiont of Bathymodiolus sp.]
MGVAFRSLLALITSGVRKERTLRIWALPNVTTKTPYENGFSQ